MNRTFLAVSALALLAIPGIASAQQDSSSVSLEANVEKACVIDSPTNADLELGEMTGSDGRLLPELLTTSQAGEALTITNAWCNSPSTLTLTASPMTMVDEPSWGQQADFARAIGYNVEILGFPVAADLDTTAPNDTDDFATSLPWTSNNFQVVFSDLQPLLSGGPSDTAFIEAGSYKGTVEIKLTAN